MTNQDFIGYEYNDFIVDREMKSIFTDGIKNFGWIVESTSDVIGKPQTVMLRSKRNRNYRSNAELNRLQSQFESYFQQIKVLKRRKYFGSATVPYVIGVAGTCLMTGSVFAVTAGNIPLCVILAIPAFVGWVLPYLLFRKFSERQKMKVDPLIEKTYDEIYETCKKANSLLF